jgi:hypothetical protein
MHAALRGEGRGVSTQYEGGGGGRRGGGVSALHPEAPRDGSAHAGAGGRRPRGWRAPTRARRRGPGRQRTELKRRAPTSRTAPPAPRAQAGAGSRGARLGGITGNLRGGSIARGALGAPRACRQFEPGHGATHCQRSITRLSGAGPSRPGIRAQARGLGSATDSSAAAPRRPRCTGARLRHRVAMGR